MSQTQWLTSRSLESLEERVARRRSKASTSNMWIRLDANGYRLHINVSRFVGPAGQARSRRLRTRSHENQILAASPVQLNSTMTARLDLSCLLSPKRGRGLLKAPELPNTSGAKYTRYVQFNSRFNALKKFYSLWDTEIRCHIHKCSPIIIWGLLIYNLIQL